MGIELPVCHVDVRYITPNAAVISFTAAVQRPKKRKLTVPIQLLPVQTHVARLGRTTLTVLAICFAHCCVHHSHSVRTSTLPSISPHLYCACSFMPLPLSGGVVDATHTELLKILKRCIKDLELSKPDLTDWLEIPLSHFEQWLEGEMTEEKAAVSALPALTLLTALPMLAYCADCALSVLTMLAVLTVLT